MCHDRRRSATILGIMLWFSTATVRAQENAQLNLAFTPADPIVSLNRSVVNITPSANRRVADRSFWRLVLFTGGSAVLDGETTMRGLQYPGHRELNPLLGSHPNRARFYFTVGAADVGVSYLAWHLKKNGHEKAWKIPLLGATAVHLGGAANNLRY